MRNKDIKMFFATHEHVSMVGPAFDVCNALYIKVVMRMLIVICYVTLLVAFYMSVSAFCTPTGWYAHRSEGNLLHNLSVLNNLFKFCLGLPS
jgi:hypothetical protein